MTIHTLSSRRRTAFAAAIAAAVALTALLFLLREGMVSPVRAAVDEARQDGAWMPPPPSASPEREAGHLVPDAPTTPPVDAKRTFDAIWRDLVATATPGEAMHDALADAADERKRLGDLVAELLTAVPDVVPPVLTRLHGLASPWSAAGDRIAARLAVVVFDITLQQMAHEVRDGSSSRVAVTVALLLDAMVAGPDFAGLVADVLADAPYLDASHEDRLLALARAARDELQFLADPVRRLLVTLWSNRSQAGDATAVADLLAWFGDPEAGVLGEAALQRLLAEERYRMLVVERLCREKRPQAMTMAAMHVVRTLPAAAAIEVVRSLQTGFPEHSLFAAYGWLAAADPGALHAEYERCLADGVLPRHRAELVSALGTIGQGEPGLRVAELALRADPDRRVRSTALLAWCNRAPIGEAAAALDRATGDPAFGARYDLDAVVFALQALAMRPDHDLNTIDRVSAFLLVQPSLSVIARRAVEEVRREHLPH